MQRRFGFFAFLLAVAILVDHVRVATLLSPLRSATVVAALAVMWRPSSVRLFLCLVITQTVDLYVRLPWVDNLQMMLLLVGLTMLLALPLDCYRERRLPTGERWLAGFEPLLRLSTICMYSFTFWHKLNRDFLDPETSCALNLYETMRAQAWMPGFLLPAANDLGPVLIFGTWAFEAGIPLLLAIPRTARIGIAAALGFHYVLGLARFYEFSLAASALLFLFAPPALTPALASWWRDQNKRRIAAVSLAVVCAISLLAGLQTLGAWDPAASLRENVRFPGHLVLGYLWWLSAIPSAVCVYFLWRLPHSAQPPHPRFRPSHLILLVAPLLVVLNGAAPYLGLKTENSFAMYSNLRTEGGTTNHFVLKTPAALAGYQTRLVRILESSDEELTVAASERRLVPFFEVRRLASGDRPIELVYESDGAVYRVPPVGDDPALEAPTYLERKLLSFRRIYEGESRCGH